MIYNVCGMLIFFAENNSSYTCSKWKFVDLLDKEIHGLEVWFSILHCIRESEEIMKIMHEALLRWQQAEGKVYQEMEENSTEEEVGKTKNISHSSRKFSRHSEKLMLSNQFQNLLTDIDFGPLEKGILSQLT